MNNDMKTYTVTYKLNNMPKTYSFQYLSAEAEAAYKICKAETNDADDTTLFEYAKLYIRFISLKYIGIDMPAIKRIFRKEIMGYEHVREDVFDTITMTKHDQYLFDKARRYAMLYTYIATTRHNLDISEGELQEVFLFSKAENKLAVRLIKKHIIDHPAYSLKQMGIGAKQYLQSLTDTKQAITFNSFC